MTDYIISAVKYKDSNNFEGKELFSAKVHIFNNTTKKPFDTTPYEWKRKQIIGAIKMGKKFKTYYKNKKNKPFKLGSAIKIYTINNDSFIKTKRSKAICDNLSELPEF